MLKLKRVYETPNSEDGVRILVERLWPRGLTKERAKIDIWLKDIAPSTELRKWYNHIPERWPEFQKRYQLELEENYNVVRGLKKKVDTTDVTLIFAAKDAARNSAVVLKNHLEKKNFLPEKKFL
ncbi:DUF488 family protein [candidate division KSB1 bacterium]|nr:DUF488 family protein [candidate division KSB1 bacterium]